MNSKILTRYLIALFVYIGVFIGLLVLGWYISSNRIWYATDLFYPIVHAINEHVVFVIFVGWLGGWMIITMIFLRNNMRYLNQVVDAAELLANPDITPIELSPILRPVQDELNLVREHAMRTTYLAREAEQRKNDLIVYLAHDLKTPLTSVIGYLTLLKDEPQISVEMRSKYTGIALNKAERLETLINEFFDITRFNLTAITLETETINLSRIVEQISNEFLPILSEKQLYWENDIAENLEIACDPDKMERVLDNLIRNAINYSYSNSPICISLFSKDSGVMIRVVNHGKTIPREKLGRIFEQFFRLDSARSSASGGAGLGLAIAKEIVELHGGTITAESEHEEICFSVWIPYGNV